MVECPLCRGKIDEWIKGYLFNRVADLGCSSVPSPRGALVGLAPPNKAPSPRKLKRETLYISGVLVNFIMSSPPAQTQSSPAQLQNPPTENFLATVLVLLKLQYFGVCWSVSFGKLSSEPRFADDCRLRVPLRNNTRCYNNLIIPWRHLQFPFKRPTVENWRAQDERETYHCVVVTNQQNKVDVRTIHNQLAMTCSLGDRGRSRGSDWNDSPP